MKTTSRRSRRLGLVTVAVTATVTVLSACSSASSSTGALPGQVKASQAPFDATSATSIYVDRCVKDGGTVDRCQCEAADIISRLGNDGLDRINKGLAGSVADREAANKERQPSVTACGWPNTKL